MTMEVTALKPDYYEKFKCIGSKCNISCCNYNWNIAIDKETYQKYKKFNSIGKAVNGDYTRKVRTSIEKNLKTSKATNHGRIKHIKYEKAFILGNDAYKAIDYICPFSKNDNMCEMQEKFGEDMLSLTCRLFPRNLNLVFEDYEQALTTECEVVCKLLYEITEPIRFRRHRSEILENQPVNKRITKEMLGHNEVLKHFNIIRASCLKIMQSREFDLDNRMVLLGLFITKISTLKGKNLDKIPTYAKAFLRSQQEYLEYFDIKVRKDSHTLKNKNDKHLYPHKILLNAINFDEIELGYEEKSILIRLKNNLVVYYKNYEILQKKANNILQNDTHYLENIMVNILISKLYPFNVEYDTTNSVIKHIDLMDNYLIFVWTYVSLKVMVTSSITLSETPNIDLEMLYKTVVLHSREVVSSTEMLTAMCDSLKKSGYTSLSQVAILIKNA